MYERRASLPHTGIATFAKAPYVEDLTTLAAEVGILGIPTDIAAGMRPGCRQGPRAIRDASTRFGFLGRAGTDGYFDINQDRRLLQGVRIADCGDADVILYDAERNVEIIEACIRSILDRGALPVVIGGDHSVSYPVIRAFNRADPLTIILFDAHLDYRDEVLGLKLTNNSPFRNSPGPRPEGHHGRTRSGRSEPYLDHAELTQHAAAQLLIEALATAFAGS